MESTRKNRTRYKTLNVAENHPGIFDVYVDSDGIWIEVHAGWTCEIGGAHGGRADTVKEALSLIRGIKRCSCEQFYDANVRCKDVV